MPEAARRIWLCADDYGMAPGVSQAIRTLIAHGRLNATSVMVASPHFNAEEAVGLDALNADSRRAALGLHVTLTGPFAPMSDGFGPLRQARFPMLAEMVKLAFARRLRPDALATEIVTQLRAFRAAFGRPPDFVDGHQHVHLFPQVRGAFLRAVAEAAPQAWVRQCRRAHSLRRWRDRKGLGLDILSLGFRHRARRLGLTLNAAFAGAYDFNAAPDFATLFPRFLDGLPDGGLIMCHPGVIDADLQRLDPLTTLRESEFAYLDSETFAAELARHKVMLARPGEIHPPA
jgi:predicted glycoside hydrolase/deacetylase ChbG (UPF0249 family)